jgi:hypothetical protein
LIGSAANHAVQRGVKSADDEAVQGFELMGILTKLNQEDLQSRDEEFKGAASAMSEKVLPGIKHLTKSVAEIAEVEGTLKTTMSDLVKVSASIGFFGIPAL